MSGRRQRVSEAVAQWLLTVVAVGFAPSGVYALARARRPDRDPST
jgi:hypothetical protein